MNSSFPYGALYWIFYEWSVYVLCPFLIEFFSHCFSKNRNEPHGRHLLLLPAENPSLLYFNFLWELPLLHCGLLLEWGASSMSPCPGQLDAPSNLNCKNKNRKQWKLHYDAHNFLKKMGQHQSFFYPYLFIYFPWSHSYDTWFFFSSV